MGRRASFVDGVITCLSGQHGTSSLFLNQISMYMLLSGEGDREVSGEGGAEGVLVEFGKVDIVHGGTAICLEVVGEPGCLLECVLSR